LPGSRRGRRRLALALLATTALGGTLAAHAPARGGDKTKPDDNLPLSAPDRGTADFDMHITGYIRSGFGFSEQSHIGGQHPVALDQETETHFVGGTTLENGLRVGVNVELKGTTDEFHERWVYLRGGFGELRYGDQDDARRLLSYAAPEPTRAFGVNTPSLSFNNATTGRGYIATTNTTFPKIESESAKIVYFTPSFGGFQLALSYAPDGSKNQPAFGTRPNNDAVCGNNVSGYCSSSVSNDLSVGFQYSGDFGGVALRAGGGATWGYNEKNVGIQRENPSAYAFGATLERAGFAFGGSLAVVRSYDLTGDDSLVFDVGATYATGGLVVGLDYSRGDYQRQAFTGGSSDRLDDLQLGASYAIGPGISLDGFIGYLRADPGSRTGVPISKGMQGGIGTSVDF
jgi:outer membrane protein OmpU